jgi:hypothetical protein
MDVVFWVGNFANRVIAGRCGIPEATVGFHC